VHEKEVGEVEEVRGCVDVSDVWMRNSTPWLEQGLAN